MSNATNVSFISNAISSVTIGNDDGSVQMSNAAISVSEGAGFVTVTVTRIGDTAKTSSVQLTTSDTAG